MKDAATPHSADAQHPWIGLASFTEGDREFFAGRGEEIEKLFRLVRRDTLTLLYGISGLGKTSLLQAGLFPALPGEDQLPVAIRLDHVEGADSCDTSARWDRRGRSRGSSGCAAPLLGRVALEYFHRQDNHFWSRTTIVLLLFSLSNG